MYRNKKPVTLPVMPDGLLYSLIPVAAGAATAVWSWIAACFFIIPLAFIFYFFRNPSRKDVASPADILSPADGKVLSITEIGHEDFIGGRAVSISIFLSIFNVHINRSPIGGTVRYHRYRDGAMLPAFKSHASDINERNTIGIESDDGYRVLVHQITGFIARRIVWWVKPGSRLDRAERYGFIKFGSCTQLVVPYGTEIRVAVGQKVRAAETVMGRRI
ncbi:MAG: phosphatidylserine decarboxylase family protein [Saccharofermentanales bacterium]